MSVIPQTPRASPPPLGPLPAEDLKWSPDPSPTHAPPPPHPLTTNPRSAPGHDIAEILLKVALKHQKSNPSVFVVKRYKKTFLH